tara:strand:+ start:175 stop:336 length:162 start_codon:yes stop_codon:yes gene_type:complete
MIICKAKLDERGRLSLPMSFLKANNIKNNTHVKVVPVTGRNDAIKLEFQLEEE